MTGVTVALSRQIQAGAEGPFETWLHEVSRQAAHSPGFLGATVLRPAYPAQGSTAASFTTVLRFTDTAAWQRWQEAPERLALLGQADALSGTPLLTQRAEGLDFWFEQPAMAASPQAPVRWKMVVVVTCVVFVSFNIIPLIYAPLRAVLPGVLVQLLSIATAITLMTYVIMPRLTKLLHPWLTGHANLPHSDRTEDRS